MSTNDAQTFNGLFQFCLLRFIGCGQFGKPFIRQFACHIVLREHLSRVRFMAAFKITDIGPCRCKGKAPLYD